jgi:hypothetical protein
MKQILVLTTAVLLAFGAQAATGHHATKAGAMHAKPKVAQAHKKSASKHGAKKAAAHKHVAPKKAAPLPMQSAVTKSIGTGA